MLSPIPQGRDGPASIGTGLWLHHSTEEIYSCKYLSPLEAIKGEPGLTTKFGFIRFTHAATILFHKAATSTLSTTKSRPGT